MTAPNRGPAGPRPMGPPAARMMMGGAPPEVVAKASDALTSVTGEGGGIAEAIGRILAA